jgi:hypothetical protein
MLDTTTNSGLLLFRLPSLALSAPYAAASQIPAAEQNSAACAPRMR